MHSFVFTQLYYIKTLKIPVCFGLCGIIIREYVRHPCINLSTTFNCNTLARDQQTSAFVPNLPCTLVPCLLSAYTQTALKHG
jgi:hypothetical protein